MKKYVDYLDGVEVDAALHERTMKRLRQSPAARRKRTGFRFAGLAAACAVVILLCVWAIPGLVGTGNNVELGNNDNNGNNGNNGNNSNNGNNGNNEEIKYAEMSADWPIYSDARELLKEWGNLVFIGKVTGISFAVLDITTGLAPTEATEDRNRRLYTLYEVEIIVSYKGDASDVTYFKVIGGLRDYRADEQLRIMKEGNARWWEYGIPIFGCDQELKCEIGKTYLFVMLKSETGNTPKILNPWQSLYDLNDPLTGQGFPNREISIKEILSEIGQEDWDSFWKQWLEQHPDYQE
ncbi:MAG: hypothetical protein FWD39_00700 [Clostridiales bacterium]|nr:hypothetical protein [Clostridiales bacterium]